MVGKPPPGLPTVVHARWQAGGKGAKPRRIERAACRFKGPHREVEMALLWRNLCGSRLQEAAGSGRSLQPRCTGGVVVSVSIVFVESLAAEAGLCVDPRGCISSQRV